MRVVAYPCLERTVYDRNQAFVKNEIATSLLPGRNDKLCGRRFLPYSHYEIVSHTVVSNGPAHDIAH